jgi:hypothetical protein
MTVVLDSQVEAVEGGFPADGQKKRASIMLAPRGFWWSAQGASSTVETLPIRPRSDKRLLLRPTHEYGSRIVWLFEQNL